VKLARFRKLKAVCFLSCVDYRPNARHIMINRACQVEVTYERRRENKEVKKVNMVDVFSIQE
jgi:hypothetical protein